MKRKIEVVIDDEATADGFNHPVGVVIKITATRGTDFSTFDLTKLYTYAQIDDWRPIGPLGKREGGIARHAAAQLAEFICPELNK